MGDTQKTAEERREIIKRGLVEGRNYRDIAAEAGTLVGLVREVGRQLVEAGELIYTPESYSLPPNAGK